MTKEKDDAAARRARADAIRRERDIRNAEIQKSIDQDAAVTPTPTNESGESMDATEEESPPGATPNYVDLINRQMRRGKGKREQP